VDSDAHLISWDAGSGSCRCLVVDGEGRQMALTRDDVPLVRAEDVPGSLAFDPQQMWDVFVRLTREALASLPAREIAALSTTSFRDGVVFLDGEGEVVYAGTNRDARSAAQGFDMAQAYGDAIYNRTGRWPLGTDGAAHLLWMRRFRPEVYQRIDRKLMVSDWLVFRLCGAHSSEPSNASSWLLLDVRESRWSMELARLLDLPVKFLPPKNCRISVGGWKITASSLMNLCGGHTVYGMGSNTLRV